MLKNISTGMRLEVLLELVERIVVRDIIGDPRS
jgi:hypothetical protein